MEDTSHADSLTSGLQDETALERADRIRREAVLIAEAEAEMDAGLWLDEAELDAWLAAVEQDENAPLPPSKGCPP